MVLVDFLVCFPIDTHAIGMRSDVTRVELSGRCEWRCGFAKSETVGLQQYIPYRLRTFRPLRLSMLLALSAGNRGVAHAYEAVWPPTCVLHADVLLAPARFNRVQRAGCVLQLEDASASLSDATPSRREQADGGRLWTAASLQTTPGLRM